MKLSRWDDPETGAMIYKLKIEPLDIISAYPLDNFDRLLIDDCEKSGCIADKILALEIIVRKIEQGYLEMLDTESTNG